MARGVIDGQYLPRFAHDSASDLLSALSLAVAGDIKGADKQLVTGLNKSENFGHCLEVWINHNPLIAIVITKFPLGSLIGL